MANWTKISGYVTISNPTVKAQLWATIQGRNGQTPQNVAVLIDNVMWQDVTDAYGAKTTADAAATGLSALTATVTQQGGQISAQSTQLNQVQVAVEGKADASAYLQLEAKVDANLSGAGNMIVAIPALMFHRYFKGRIAGYVIEMEQEASALLDALDGRPGVMNNAPRAAGASAGATPVTVKG